MHLEESKKDAWCKIDENAVVERVSSKANIDYIITRNIKDYQHSMVRALLPNDFTALIEEE